jgi:hypothetical protein
MPQNNLSNGGKITCPNPLRARATFAEAGGQLVKLFFARY